MSSIQQPNFVAPIMFQGASVAGKCAFSYRARGRLGLAGEDAQSSSYLHLAPLNYPKRYCEGSGHNLLTRSDFSLVEYLPVASFFVMPSMYRFLVFVTNLSRRNCMRILNLNNVNVFMINKKKCQLVQKERETHTHNYIVFA